jgi:hypothetical protein
MSGKGENNITEQLINRFGAEVVANAVDQGIDASLKYLNEHTSDKLNGYPEGIVEKAVSFAAFHAMEAFFSNHDLVGGFKIEITKPDGSSFNLSEEFGAPLVVAFDDDGWLKEYSKHLLD